MMFYQPFLPQNTSAWVPSGVKRKFDV